MSSSSSSSSSPSSSSSASSSTRRSSAPSAPGLLSKLLSSPAARWLSNFLQNGHYLLLPLLILAEIVLNVLIIRYVPYTEIDWKAYMQEVQGVIDGNYNYYRLKGDTGPLVYPGGFVWIYQALYFLTDGGRNIFLAQCIFAVFYVLCMAFVLRIYADTRVTPAWVLLLLCLSRRVHSIFVLRLFNDGVAMLLLYGSVLFFIRDWWSAGCLMFSMATSIKMNILLFSPALALLLLLRFGWEGALIRVGLCATWQLIVGIPFLMEAPLAYIHRSFELGRKFFYIWTVNWKFLPEHIFLDTRLAVALLLAHLCVLVWFAMRHWRASLVARMPNLQPGVQYIVLVLFSCNFIGIVFARSLHYQFYVWYYHSLPALLWLCPFPTYLRLLILLGIEVCWNVFPSSFVSSLTLQLLHLTILLGLASSHFPLPYRFVSSPPPSSSSEHTTGKHEKEEKNAEQRKKKL